MAFSWVAASQAGSSAGDAEMLPLPEAAFDLWLGLGQRTRRGAARGHLMYNTGLLARTRAERVVATAVAALELLVDAEASAALCAPEPRLLERLEEEAREGASAPEVGCTHTSSPCIFQRWPIRWKLRQM